MAGADDNDWELVATEIWLATLDEEPIFTHAASASSSRDSSDCHGIKT
jgi:hypothetical protein